LAGEGATRRPLLKEEDDVVEKAIGFTRCCGDDAVTGGDTGTGR